MSSPQPLPRESVPAIITAGGRLEGPLAARAGTEMKALAPARGRTMLARVLCALSESGRVGDVLVVGPDSLASSGAKTDYVHVPEGDSGPENVRRGLAALGTAADGWALLVTCDLPLLGGGDVAWLLENAPDDADVVFPILTKAEYAAALPGSPGAYARLADGEYAGASVFLVRPAALLRNADLVGRVFDARKSQMAMARLLGLPSLLRFVTGRLTVAQAERRASELTGCRCRALPGAPVGLAADVDTLEDLLFIEAALAARAAAAAAPLSAEPTE